DLPGTAGTVGQRQRVRACGADGLFRAGVSRDAFEVHLPGLELRPWTHDAHDDAVILHSPPQPVSATAAATSTWSSVGCLIGPPISRRSLLRREQGPSPAFGTDRPRTRCQTPR